jgi:hypothetical protein
MRFNILILKFYLNYLNTFHKSYIYNITIKLIVNLSTFFTIVLTFFFPPTYAYVNFF